MSQHPYAPPAAPVAPVTATMPKLFTPQHVAVAAVLGSPLAGGIVMWITLRRLSRNADATKALLGSLVLSAALFALAFALPPEARGVAGIGIGAVLGLRYWAEKLFGQTVV